MAISTAPIPAFLAFSIALVFAARTHRPLASGDFARIVLWAAVGYGFGVAHMADGYYRHYFPQRADTMVALGYTLAALSLCVIVLSVVLGRTRRTPRKP
ncbi:MAG: hypothetical protein H6816_14815 [Phycisphaerales bacterium]|nr:hypothetical protein [Phycisphaerales bacterium]